MRVFFFGNTIEQTQLLKFNRREPGNLAPMPEVDAVIAAACRAADLALEMQRAGALKVRAKKIESDLVTEADLASERLLRGELHALDSGIDFWGEESNTPPQADAFWLVDPVDGTVNFAHGLAYWAVNVAMVADGVTQLGVTVQMPYRRIYWAQLGRGAWLREPGVGERALRVSEVDSLRHALLACGFPYHSAESVDNNDAEFVWFSPRCRGLRVLGAGALDIAQVASGMVSGFWEGWLNAWDAAAGVLMVREAGGRVTDFAGDEWAIGGPGLVASNGLIHDAMVEGIQIARKNLSERLLPV